jgi:FMN-dependent NADH-azoreductase
MATLLHLNTSPLATSVSRELTREFVSNWKASHPSSKVIDRDLAANPPKPLDQAWIFATFTPEEARQPEQKDLIAYSDEAIAELEQADEYVIGVAMHNFSIPSVLKLWIDQVVRRGRTFSYGAEGPKGTPYAAFNFIEPYLRTVLGFVGITDVKFVTAGGTAQLMSGTVDRGQFLQPHLDQVRSIAV